MKAMHPSMLVGRTVLLVAGALALFFYEHHQAAKQQEQQEQQKQQAAEQAVWKDFTHVPRLDVNQGKSYGHF